MKCLYKVPFSGFFMAYAESAEEAKKMSPDDGEVIYSEQSTGDAHSVRIVSSRGPLDSYGTCHSGAIAPACILNPASLNLRQSMAYVEEVSE